MDFITWHLFESKPDINRCRQAVPPEDTSRVRLIYILRSTHLHNIFNNRVYTSSRSRSRLHLFKLYFPCVVGHEMPDTCNTPLPHTPRIAPFAPITLAWYTGRYDGNLSWSREALPFKNPCWNTADNPKAKFQDGGLPCVFCRIDIESKIKKLNVTTSVANEYVVDTDDASTSFFG